MSARVRRLAWAVAAAALLAAPATRAARITLVVEDGPGKGFNSGRAVSPVPGNPGRTLGEQRRNVFTAAAWELATRLALPVEIRVAALWESLDCGPLSGSLASGGATQVARDFPAAPEPSTWYVSALAATLTGEPVSDTPEIRVKFNDDVGTASCLSQLRWDYQIGAMETARGRASFYRVLLHELIHGLGFVSLVDQTTGEPFNSMIDAYSRHLEDHSTGRLWGSLGDGQRRASITRTGLLHWRGPNVLARAGHLVGGRHEPSGHPQIYAPQPRRPGSSVSHWDVSVDRSVNELMEPFASSRDDFVLTGSLLQDVGWRVNRMAVAVLPDGDGQGGAAIAVLRTADGGGHLVQLMAAGGAELRRLELPSVLSVLDLAAIPLLDSASGSGLAVLAAEGRRDELVILVYDAGSGEAVRTISLGGASGLALKEVPSFAGTAVDELAVLGVRNGAPRVWIVDAGSGATIKSLNFPRNQLPVDLAIGDSFGGGPAPEIAVLMVGKGSARGKVMIKDGRSGSTLARRDLALGFAPQALALVADFADTDAPEFAVLGLWRESGETGVELFDGSSGEPLRSLALDEKLVPVGLERLPDYARSPADELVVVGRRETNLGIRILVHDSDSGARIKARGFSVGHHPRAIAVAPDLFAGSADDLLLLTSTPRDRRLRTFMVEGGARRAKVLPLP